MPGLRRSLLRRYRLLAPHLFGPGLAVLLVVLLLGDGLALFYAAPLRAALSLVSPTPTPSTIAPPVDAMTSNGGTMLLANDTFQRPDQFYWGTASDGQKWQADASKQRNFVVFHHMGVVEGTPQHVYCAALLGGNIGNVELMFTASLSQYGASELGAVVRWTDASNFYALTFNGQQLWLIRMMDGVQMPLQSVPFPAQAQKPYTFRLRASGTHLYAMVWPADQPAPAAWQISATDSVLSSGQAGLRMLIQGQDQARITAFEEIQL